MAVATFAAYLPYRRRPHLSLLEEGSSEHSRVEAETGQGGELVGRRAYLRLTVRNARRKRSAQNVRVMLDGYRTQSASSSLIRLGSPFLAWPSVFGQDDDSKVVVIFADAERPFSLGRFFSAESVELGDGARAIHSLQEGGKWHLRLELAAGFSIADNREWLPPGRWIIRVVVGADDGDARTYEIDLAWDADAPGADDVLSSALNQLAVRAV